MIQEHAKQSNKGWLVYALYCIILTGTLLYFKFPSEAFGVYLQKAVSNNYPELSLTMERVSPSLPLGVKLVQAELASRKNPENSLFRAESLSVRLKILSLYKESQEFLFKCITSGGEMTGSIRMTDSNLREPLQTSFTFNQIRFTEDSFFTRLCGYPIDGILNGSGTFSGNGSSPINGTGEAALSLQDLRINFTHPIMGLDFIEFSNILLNTTLKNQKLDLSDIELKGELMKGTVSGSLFLKKELLESRIDLKGNIDFAAETAQDLTEKSSSEAGLTRALNGGKLSFKINGTIKDPEIRLL